MLLVDIILTWSVFSLDLWLSSVLIHTVSGDDRTLSTNVIGFSDFFIVNALPWIMVVGSHLVSCDVIEIPSSEFCDSPESRFDWLM